MTVPLAKKIQELVDAGARVIGGQRPKGAPGLEDYPGATRGWSIAAAMWDSGASRAQGAGGSLPEGRAQSDFEARGCVHPPRIGEAVMSFRCPSRG